MDAPDTRKRLLEGLPEKGFGKDQLAEMQKIIDAEKSDSSTCSPTWPTPGPADPRRARPACQGPINHRFNSKQQTFLDFVPRTTWPWAWTSSIRKTSPAAAPEIPGLNRRRRADLGRPDEIGKVFSGFQKYYMSRWRRDQLHRSTRTIRSLRASISSATEMTGCDDTPTSGALVQKVAGLLERPLNLIGIAPEPGVLFHRTDSHP